LDVTAGLAGAEADAFGHVLEHLLDLREAELAAAQRVQRQLAHRRAQVLALPRRLGGKLLEHFVRIGLHRLRRHVCLLSSCGDYSALTFTYLPGAGSIVWYDSLPSAARAGTLGPACCASHAVQAGHQLPRMLFAVAVQRSGSGPAAPPAQ